MVMATPTAGVNPFVPRGASPLQAYASQVSMLDEISGTNPFESGSLDYGLFAPGMGNFGGGMPSVPGGALNFGGGCYGPGSEVRNMTQEQYLEYQDKLNTKAEEYAERAEDRQIGREVRREHRVKAARFLAGASDDAVLRQIGLLQRKIKDRNQDSISQEYTKLTNLVRKQLDEVHSENVPDEQIRAHAEKLYYQTTGKNLLDDIAEHGDSSFVQGLKKGTLLGWLFTDTKTAQGNIAEITGEKVNKKEHAKHNFGFILSLAATIGGIIFARRLI